MATRVLATIVPAQHTRHEHVSVSVTGRIRCRNRGRTPRGAGAGASRRPRTCACTTTHVSIRSSVNTPPTLRNSLSASSASSTSSSEPGTWGTCGQLLGRQVVEVLVQRVGRLDAVVDAVEPGHEHGRERQVRVARRVGAAELEALGLGALAVERDAHGGRPVALAVDQVDRRLVARAPAACSCWSSGSRTPAPPGRGPAGRRCTSGPCRTSPA